MNPASDESHGNDELDHHDAHSKLSSKPSMATNENDQSSSMEDYGRIPKKKKDNGSKSNHDNNRSPNTSFYAAASHSSSNQDRNRSCHQSTLLPFNPPSPPLTPMSTVMPNNNNNNSSNQYAGKRQVCRHFVKNNGYCKFGNKCRFLHQLPDQSSGDTIMTTPPNKQPRLQHTPTPNTAVTMPLVSPEQTKTILGGVSNALANHYDEQDLTLSILSQLPKHYLQNMELQTSNLELHRQLNVLYSDYETDLAESQTREKALEDQVQELEQQLEDSQRIREIMTRHMEAQLQQAKAEADILASCSRAHQDDAAQAQREVKRLTKTQAQLAEVYQLMGTILYNNNNGDNNSNNDCNNCKKE